VRELRKAPFLHTIREIQPWIMRPFTEMKNNSLNSAITRRRFLGVTGARSHAPVIAPSSVFVPETRAIETHHDGCGWPGACRARCNTSNFLACRTVILSQPATVDKDHYLTELTLDRINGHYKNQDCKAYHDYREIMARKGHSTRVMLAVA